TAAAAAAAAAAALTREFTSGGGVVGGAGGAVARWDRDPVRDTMAFASMKYPPGSFPPGGMYGEGAIFEQLPLQDGGKRLSVGGSVSGGASRSRIGSSDYGSQQHMSHSRSHGMLVSPRTSGTAAAAAAAARNVAGGQRHHGSGIRSNEASPVIGAATTPTGNIAGRAGASGGFGVQGGSPAAVSSGRGTP
ncbi:unnamed protein product, partial [Ectocarpus sp. 13 AM-2016]